jgi:hypothetical protein
MREEVGVSSRSGSRSRTSFEDEGVDGSMRMSSGGGKISKAERSREFVLMGRFRLVGRDVLEREGRG